MATDRHQAADKAIQQKTGIKRSPAWPEVEAAFRKAHPQCVACNETKQLNVHHMFPFHFVVGCGRPDLELDPRNLITLCVTKENEHHVLLGHLDDYESYNPPYHPDQLTAFVKKYTNETNQQIRSDATFKAAHAIKPKHLDQMSDTEKASFKKMLDHHFPPIQAIVDKANKARHGM